MRYRHPKELPRYRATGRERLAQLAQFLDGVAADQVTLTKWYGNGRGCAVGLAAVTDPWFQAQGLALCHVDNVTACQPVYEHQSDWGAVTAFFEISYAEARDLFSREGYDGNLRPGPQRIASKIRHALAVKDLRLAGERVRNPVT